MIVVSEFSFLSKVLGATSSTPEQLEPALQDEETQLSAGKGNRFTCILSLAECSAISAAPQTEVRGEGGLNMVEVPGVGS